MPSHPGASFGQRLEERGPVQRLVQPWGEGERLVMGFGEEGNALHSFTRE